MVTPLKRKPGEITLTEKLSESIIDLKQLQWLTPEMAAKLDQLLDQENRRNPSAQYSTESGPHGERKPVITADDLCRHLERVLAVDYGKQYRTWLEQTIMREAKWAVSDYREQTETLPDADTLSLKAEEARTYEEAKLEWDASDVTAVDVEPPESSSPVEPISEEAPASGYTQFLSWLNRSQLQNQLT